MCIHRIRRCPQDTPTPCIARTIQCAWKLPPTQRRSRRSCSTKHWPTCRGRCLAREADPSLRHVCLLRLKDRWPNAAAAKPRRSARAPTVDFRTMSVVIVLGQTVSTTSDGLAKRVSPRQRRLEPGSFDVSWPGFVQTPWGFRSVLAGPESNTGLQKQITHMSVRIPYQECL